MSVPSKTSAPSCGVDLVPAYKDAVAEYVSETRLQFVKSRHSGIHGYALGVEGEFDPNGVEHETCVFGAGENRTLPAKTVLAPPNTAFPLERN